MVALGFFEGIHFQRAAHFRTLVKRSRLSLSLMVNVFAIESSKVDTELYSEGARSFWLLPKMHLPISKTIYLAT